MIMKKLCNEVIIKRREGGMKGRIERKIRREKKERDNYIEKKTWIGNEKRIADNYKLM